MEKQELEINVAQLLKEPQGATREYRIEDEVEDDNGVYPVTGALKLTHESRRILVQGRLTTGINLQCSRCARPYTCPISMDIEEEYYPTVDIQTGVKLPPPEDSGAFTIDEHHVLDLTEAVRQYRVIMTPMKPLCSEGCQGICPTCGKDLSEGPCSCPTEHIDPRWAELLRLKRKSAQTRDKGRR
jgi:uncharacterized protein